MRREGEVVLDRAIGHARGNGPDDPEDAEKVAATPGDAVHGVLGEQGDHRVRRPQADRARADRRSTTRSPSTSRNTTATARARSRSARCSRTAPACPNLPREALSLEYVGDRDYLVEALCDAKPFAAPGKRLAYHAISGGFILGEVVAAGHRQGRSARCWPRSSSTRSAFAGPTTASRPRTCDEVGAQLHDRRPGPAAALDAASRVRSARRRARSSRPRTTRGS